MKLILARHGNTFESHETPTWVGRKNDLPLTKMGIEQAKSIALYLKNNNIKLNALYCGPLQRTLVYAKTIADELTIDLQPIIDQRLNEIDYGTWSGLTSAQVREKFGLEELERWEKYSKWPTTANWQESEDQTIAEVTSFAHDLINKYPKDTTVLAISSNGLLRYFLKLIPNEFDARVKTQTFKVATGKICQLTYENNQWKLDFWNVGPLDKNNPVG